MFRRILLAAALSVGAGLPSSTSGWAADQSHSRSTEPITVLPTEPHQWRKDPDCYVAKSAFDPNNTLSPMADALKWHRGRHFSGYLFTNFEGWTFVPAKRREHPNSLGEGRYYASVYYAGTKIAAAPEPRIYWVRFVGREALCNTQRPQDRAFDAPFSPNLVIVDRLEVLGRVR